MSGISMELYIPYDKSRTSPANGIQLIERNYYQPRHTHRCRFFNLGEAERNTTQHIADKWQTIDKWTVSVQTTIPSINLP